MRFGTVAIIGRTNVGKSTFLNSAIGEDLAIISPLPQTTREALLGVGSHGDAQMAFLDTPGLHRPRTELGRRMNATALEAARASDVVVFMTDVASLAERRPKDDEDPARLVASGDRELLELVPTDKTCILVINKVDTLRDKRRLLALIAGLSQLREFAAIVPVSVQEQDGVDRVLAEIAERLPEGAPAYDPETLTDRGPEYFVREYVREQVMRQAGAEVPHAVAVSVEEVTATKSALIAKATIHVEKVGQRKILIGHGGSRIKEIGTLARQRLEQLFERKVHLELFVRVTASWKDAPRQLAELGYDTPEDKALANAVPAGGKARKRSKSS